MVHNLQIEEIQKLLTPYNTIFIVVAEIRRDEDLN